MHKLKAVSRSAEASNNYKHVNSGLVEEFGGFPGANANASAAIAHWQPSARCGIHLVALPLCLNYEYVFMFLSCGFCEFIVVLVSAAPRAFGRIPLS